MSFEDICARVEHISRARVGLGGVSEKHAIRINAIEQERDLNQKNGRGLARGARNYNFGRSQIQGQQAENDRRGKGDQRPRNDRYGRTGERQNQPARYNNYNQRSRFDRGGKGWSRHNGKGHNDRRSQGSRMGDRNQRDGKGQGRPNDYARVEQPSGNRCTWDECRGKPSHAIIDCPELAKRPCIRRQCRGQLHFRNQCPNVAASVRREDECQTAGQLAHTEPTTSSADGTAFSASRQWPRGTDGICTAQPSVNREIVPVQQPPRVVRMAHVR